MVKREVTSKLNLVVISTVVLLLFLGLVPLAEAAILGMDRESYGVFDRGGWHSVEDYPFTVGQEYQTGWEHVHPARHTYDWTALDAQLQFAYEQNQKFFVKVQPVSHNGEPPTWIYSAGVPQIVCPSYTYGYYLDEDYKTYHSEMILALGDHLRNEVPAHLQGLIAFVRVDTGCTGDEMPYEGTDKSSVPAEYQISNQEWQDYRLWLFDIYDQAFQEGSGYKIPLLFAAVTPPNYPVEWNWCETNITDGLGVKYAGEVRGHHLTDSQTVTDDWKNMSVDSDYGLFSRNEMDQTWSKPFFQLNVRIGMYWHAVEQLHPGLSVWDVEKSCLKNTYIDDYEFVFNFFNKWAAEIVPATAGGGFSILHEGLDSSDAVKFPEATFGSASKSNVQRYIDICQAYSSRGAQMDHADAATWGQVTQRSEQNGYNDAGWGIVPGNYERFITQIDAENTSIGLFRIGGNLNSLSHPYDRFARSFENSSGKNTMYFDIHDELLPSQGQPVQVSVIYYDNGTGSFELQYDAKGNSQKTAFVVNKTNSGTWQTATVVLTDGLFGNHGPNGADLMLLNLDSDDDIFHMIEVLKLANVNIGTDGRGTVEVRNGASLYSLSEILMEGTRLDLTATAEQGWEFINWSGDASGTTDFTRIYPTADTRATANFSFTGRFFSADDFQTGTWSGGQGWNGAWATSGGAFVTTVVELNSNGQMTRTLNVPVNNATLEFEWDADSIDAGESAQAEVYDGDWHVVWTVTDADNGSDNGGSPDELVPASVDVSSYGTISQVRFTLNAGGGVDRIWVDNVNIFGYDAAATNHVPTFSSDPIVKSNGMEGSSYSGSISTDASDPDSDPLTFSRISGPAWLSVASDGTLSGTPSASDAGVNAFTVQVDDGIDGTDQAILIIFVDEINDDPVFVADPFTKPDAAENDAYSGTIADDAYDLDVTDTLTYSKESGPSWLSVAADGALSGTPGAGDVGLNAFTVRAQDDSSAFDDAVLNINVISGSAGGTLTLNPTDDTWVTASAPTANKGSTTNLRVRGDAPANYREAFLKFNVTGVTASVTLAKLRVYSIDVVQTVNCNEVADTSWTEGTMTWNDKPAMGPLIDSLVGTPATWCEWDVTSYITGDGIYSFGLQGTAGADDFSSKEGSYVPELVIDYGGTGGDNNPPTFTSDPIVEIDATQDVAYSSTIADDATDPDAGDTLFFSKVSGPAWLSVAGDGTLSGTPTTGDVGLNSWTVQVDDNSAAFDQATLEITVNGAGGGLNFSDGFESGNFSAGGWSTSGNTSVSGAAAYSGANGAELKSTSSIEKAISTAGSTNIQVGYVRKTAAYDNGEELTVEWSTNGSSWNLLEATSQTSWAVKNFALPAGAENQAGFRLRFSTNANKSNEKAHIDDVTITGTGGGGGNNPPAFTSDPIVETNATEDAAYSSSIADDASDPDSDPMTFSKISGPAWLAIASNGALSGTPATGDVGLNSWTVEVDDGQGGTDQATLEITVDAAGGGNNPPAFTSDPIVEINATEDAAYSSSIADDASDPDSDPMTFSKISGPAWLLIASSGALSGTPGAGDVGLNSFTVEVDDGQGGTDQATLEITVDAAGGSPPGQASSPNPTDGKTKVKENANLSWSAGSGATSHDVYFGTTQGSLTFQGNQTGTSFNPPGNMPGGTWHYWRIDEVNASGTTTGIEWTFKTK
jgi:hypothetical protein